MKHVYVHLTRSGPSDAPGVTLSAHRCPVVWFCSRPRQHPQIPNNPTNHPLLTQAHECNKQTNNRLTNNTLNIGYHHRLYHHHHATLPLMSMRSINVSIWAGVAFLNPTCFETRTKIKKNKRIRICQSVYRHSDNKKIHWVHNMGTTWEQSGKHQ